MMERDIRRHADARRHELNSLHTNQTQIAYLISVERQKVAAPKNMTL